MSADRSLALTVQLSTHNCCENIQLQSSIPQHLCISLIFVLLQPHLINSSFVVRHDHVVRQPHMVRQPHK